MNWRAVTSRPPSARGSGSGSFSELSWVVCGVRHEQVRNVDRCRRSGGWSVPSPPVVNLDRAEDSPRGPKMRSRQIVELQVGGCRIRHRCPLLIGHSIRVFSQCFSSASAATMCSFDFAGHECAAQPRRGHLGVQLDA